MSETTRFCSSCGGKLTAEAKFCDSCGKPTTAQAKPVRKRFPAALWILPIAFGIIGGIIAALVSALEYHDQWWQLLVIGIIMSFVWYFLFAFVIF